MNEKKVENYENWKQVQRIRFKIVKYRSSRSTFLLWGENVIDWRIDANSFADDALRMR